MKRLFPGVLILFLSLALTGCVRRIVTIDSQPQGAEIYFDRKLVGQTPYAHEFLYYGTHRLELVKEGYANLYTPLKLKGPLYEYFPFSVFSEILIPWEITDEHNFTFKLEKGQTREPVISPIEQPQPALPQPQLKQLKER